MGVLAILGGLFALDLFTMSAVREHQDATSRLGAELQALDAVQALPATVLNMQSGMRGYLLTGSKAELAQYRDASERFPGLAEAALRFAGDDTEIRTRLQEAQALTARWVDTRLSPLVVKRNAGEGSTGSMREIVRSLRSAHGDLLAQRILARLDAASASQQKRVGAALEELEKHSARIAGWMRIRALALLVSVAALALLLGRALVHLSGQSSSRAAAERSARASAAALDAMNDASPLGMFLTNAAGECRDANAAMERITGLPRKALTGIGWMAALHPDDRDRVKTAWAMALSSNQPFVSEHRFLHRDGTVPWVSMKAAAVRDGDELIGHICTVEEVTERRNVEEALRRSEERLQLALEGGALALFDWHLPSGEIVLSRQWQTFGGEATQGGATTARRLADLLHPEDREPLRQALIAALKGRTPLLTAEFRIRSASGAWKPLQLRARVTERDVVGRAVQLAGTLRPAD